MCLSQRHQSNLGFSRPAAQGTQAFRRKFPLEVKAEHVAHRRSRISRSVPAAARSRHRPASRLLCHYFYRRTAMPIYYPNTNSLYRLPRHTNYRVCPQTWPRIYNLNPSLQRGAFPSRGQTMSHVRTPTYFTLAAGRSSVMDFRPRRVQPTPRLHASPPTDAPPTQPGLLRRSRVIALRCREAILLTPNGPVSSAPSPLRAGRLRRQPHHLRRLIAHPNLSMPALPSLDHDISYGPVRTCQRRNPPTGAYNSALSQAGPPKASSIFVGRAG